jgi:hypothetical protein
MGRNPNNGPSLSAAPPKKAKPMTEAELETYYARRATEQKEVEASCAKTRKFNQLMQTDRRAAFEMIGLSLPPAPMPIRRRI